MSMSAATGKVFMDPETLIRHIVDHARRLYWDNLQRGEYSYAVDGAAKLIQIETGVRATLKQRQQAEEILRKGKDISKTKEPETR